jgi:glutamate/tyrosine decarboxylase-like PLP-dependent enzyme
MKNKLTSLSKNPKFSSNFLSEDESNIDLLLDKIKTFHLNLDGCDKISARRKVKNFNYNDEIDTSFFNKNGVDSSELWSKLKWIFDGTQKWQSSNTAFNINPSPLLDAVATTTVTNLLNPNCHWDVTSGKFILAEKNIIRLLGERIFGNSDCDGLLSFGGKGTLLYAVKTGLGNCDPQHKQRGLNGEYVVVVSYNSHFCISDICDYVGIGSNSLLKISTTPNREMDYEKLKISLEKAIVDGKKIATIICNGGTTLDFCIDNARKIREVCDFVENKYELPYKIHIHGDMVFGWTWLFTNKKRLQEINDAGSNNILKIQDKLSNMCVVDSIGADFHKMGLCPYGSSFFVVKNKKSFDSLSGAVKSGTDCDYGTYHSHYASLENSRSGTGIISAYTALCTLGENGITDYLVYLMHVKEKYKQLIETKFSHIFKILNTESLGFELILEVSVNGKTFDKDDYVRLCDKLWYSDDNSLVVSHVLRYFINGKPNPALLIYSMSPHADEESCLNVLTNLECECINISNIDNKDIVNADAVFVPK